MLERPPPALLGPVSELLEADLLVERDGKLGFWHDITREAVRSSIPVTARRALDRQAADILLASGALPVEVALQLAASAGPGDEVAVVTLLDAARALVDDRSGDRRTVRAARARDRTRRSPTAGRAGRDDRHRPARRRRRRRGDRLRRHGAARTLPPNRKPRSASSIAGMFAVSAGRRISAGRTALALPGLSATLRARHRASLAYNLMTAGRIEEARGELEAARAAVAAAGDARASFTLLTAESGDRVRRGALPARAGGRHRRPSRRRHRRGRSTALAHARVARRASQRARSLRGGVRDRRRRRRGRLSRSSGLGVPDVRDVARPDAASPPGA